jgi:hypothetical protein
MDIKEKTRERNEARFFAMDTLRMVIEWVKETNPQVYLSKEASEAIGEARQAKMRDWVDKASDLIEKTWELPNLLADDAIKVLKEAMNASKEDTSKGE